MKAIQTENLVREYDGRRAVDGLTQSSVVGKAFELSALRRCLACGGCLFVSERLVSGIPCCESNAQPTF